MKYMIILLLDLIICCSVLAQDRLSDSLALLTFYEDVGGPEWNDNSGWLTSAPLDDWLGIKTDGDRVIEIKISNNNMKGVFPNSIYNMDALQSMIIFNADLSGQLSEEIYKLQNLRSFGCSFCGLEGSIPKKLDTLPFLDNIRLDRNNFTGELPDLPKQMNLLKFELNELIGEIPDSWEGFDAWTVSIHGNNLEGSLEIGSSWSGLRSFQGFNNNWDEQPLPEWIDDLPELKSFLCANCNLVGEIPAFDWSNSPEMYQIDIKKNELHGDVSYLIPDPEDEEIWIDINFNNFSGTLPTHLMKNVFRFLAADNEFTSITTFDYEVLNELNINSNKFKISALVDELPTVIEDPNVQIFYSDQKSIFSDRDSILYVGDELLLEADEVGDNYIYQWYHNNIPVEGAVSSSLSIQNLTFGDEGDYWCEVSHPSLVAINEELVIFEGRKLNIEIRMTSNIEETIGEKILIYPNPTYGQIYLENVQTPFNLVIINAMGDIVEKKNQDTPTIDMIHLPDGIYTLCITTSNQIHYSKTIKL